MLWRSAWLICPLVALDSQGRFGALLGFVLAPPDPLCLGVEFGAPGTQIVPFGSCILEDGVDLPDQRLVVPPGEIVGEAT